MKRKWTRSLALSLGLLASTGARAEETVWHAQPPAPAIAVTTPAATIGRPVVIAASPAPVTDHGPLTQPGSPGVIATIGRPVPIASTAQADTQIKPAGFSVPGCQSTKIDGCPGLTQPAGVQPGGPDMPAG